MQDDAPAQLYRAFVSHDPAQAIAVVQSAKSSGVAQDQLFDRLFAPAMSLLGGAWANGTLDEYAFTQAAVVAEQVTSFVTPAPSAAGGGTTVVVGTMQGDAHDVEKSIVAAALAQAGHRIIDLGADARPSDFLERVEETGARVVIVFAQLAVASEGVVRVREMLLGNDRPDVAMLVAGGLFAADTQRAKEAGAHGVIRGAESAIALVGQVVARQAMQT